MYAGTGAFKIYPDHIDKFFYPLKLKVERADGVASVTYQGSVAFSDTKTRTISFPLNLEIRTYWSTYGYTKLASR